jgi:uncharacterized protein with NRDE domain
MCTLAIYFRVFDRYPVVIAANRDEILGRPARAPEELSRAPLIIGGRDVKAGGTWLGINEHGMVAALLNRRSLNPADPERRSRGLLCLEALCAGTLDEAERYASAQQAQDYNPFNLLVASRAGAFVAYNHGSRIETFRLLPGLHLLTNLDINDFECPKISRAFSKFNSLAQDGKERMTSVELCAELKTLLADHSTQLDPRSGHPNSLCLHLDGYGTRSSSLILLGNQQHQAEHFFADGPPCSTSFHSAPVPAPSAHSSR